MRFLICLFSAGWLYPIWVTAYLYLEWLNSEAGPRLRGENPRSEFSFNALTASFDFFTVGCIWLALVILYWSWKLNRPLPK
jgi:hypothetical protein